MPKRINTKRNNTKRINTKRNRRLKGGGGSTSRKTRRVSPSLLKSVLIKETKKAYIEAQNALKILEEKAKNDHAAAQAREEKMYAAFRAARAALKATAKEFSE